MNKEQFVSGLSTILTIIGALISSLGLYPYYVFIFIVSNFGWLYCGIKWKKKSMVVTNVVLFGVEVGGLVWKFS